MKKTTKGAIAAAAAGVLLLGGAGTVAFWSDSSTIVGSDVTAGTLSLSPDDCDEGWTYATGNAGEGDAVALIVPGDVISKECTFEVTATGDNLVAELTTPDAVQIDSGGTTTLDATVAAEYTVGETAATTSTTITDANDGQKVTATITVTFPYGSPTVNANDTQGFTAALDAIEVTLEQTGS